MYIQLKICGVYKLYNKTMVIYKVVSKNYKDCSSYCSHSSRPKKDGLGFQPLIFRNYICHFL